MVGPPADGTARGIAPTGTGTAAGPVRPRRAATRVPLISAAVLALTVLLLLGVVRKGLLPPPQEAPTVALPRPSVAPTDSGPATPESQSLAPEGGAQAPWELPEQDFEALPADVPDDTWAGLQPAAFVGQEPPVLLGCPPAQTVGTRADYEELVRQQWHCVHTAWLPIFEGNGWSTVEPDVEFFPGSGSDSECGRLEAPAFYCSAGAGTVHFGDGHVEMATMWELSINEMVNHEYAHHVQSLAGITAAKLGLEQSDEMERRAELQATCWSAVMTRANDAVDFDETSWDGWQNRLQTMIIDGVHGSRESILHWGTRGLYSATLDDCDTWAVDAQSVT